MIPAIARTCAVLLSLSAVAVAEEVKIDVAAGEAAFSTQCSECHAVPSRINRKIKGTTCVEKTLWLDELLTGHHAEEQAARAQIIAFLLAE